MPEAPASADHFSLEIGLNPDRDGKPSEVVTFSCRRPTRAELDLVALARFVGVFTGYQQKILDLEERPPDAGGAKLVGNYTALACEAAEEIRKAVAKALRRIASPAGAEALLEGEDLETYRRALFVAERLFVALAPPDRVPK